MATFRVTLEADFTTEAKEANQLRQRLLRLVKATGWDESNFEFGIEMLDGRKKANEASVSILKDEESEKEREKQRSPNPSIAQSLGGTKRKSKTSARSLFVKS
ncbi:MAG: hypothetical protein OEW82_00570 [Dehalococcoidia bacterium]|nr:hypothetical protein [Dehalococcoidia bacterium]